MENQNLTEQRNALMLFLWNNRKSLMLFTGAAAVISIIISFNYSAFFIYGYRFPGSLK